jgi:hypothetical protein
MIGGIANTSAGIATGNVSDEYDLAQHFVAGALSGYAGSAYGAKLSGKSAYMFGKKTKFAKMASKFIEYGIQSSAADFAFEDEYYYRQRTWQQHLGIFAVGGMGGVMQGLAGNYGLPFDSDTYTGSVYNHIAQSMIGYGAEFLGNAIVKGGYSSIYTKQWQYKATSYTYKSIIGSLIVR